MDNYMETDFEKNWFEPDAVKTNEVYTNGVFQLNQKITTEETVHYTETLEVIDGIINVKNEGITQHNIENNSLVNVIEVNELNLLPSAGNIMLNKHKVDVNLEEMNNPAYIQDSPS